MDAKKCDRCGKFFEKNENRNFEGGKIILFNYGEFFFTPNMKRE